MKEAVFDDTVYGSDLEMWMNRLSAFPASTGSVGSRAGAGGVYMKGERRRDGGRKMCLLLLIQLASRVVVVCVFFCGLG